MTAGPARVVEGAASTVTVSVDKAFEVDQTITLTTGGTAGSTDYRLSSSSVTLDAGDLSVTATVTAVDDSVFEGDETVVVTASHNASPVGSATVTIDKEFEVDQTITLAATGGTAASGDYSLSRRR